MMTFEPGANSYIAAAGLALTIVSTVIGLKIKDAVSGVREDLLEKHAEMREDMNKKHAENSQAIAVHQAEDAQKFDSISRTLNRMDGKLDRMNGH